jgi:hypothetical protein
MTTAAPEGYEPKTTLAEIGGLTRYGETIGRA